MVQPAVQRTPPEVWVSIFEWATFVPHAFDVDAVDPFDVPSTPYIFDRAAQEDLRAILTTKTTLVLVCRRWHALATPLLYQAVSVRTNRALQRLHDTLEHFAHNHHDANRARRIRIRRFDLLKWSADHPGPASGPRVLPKPDVLARLIAHMPHLEIFCEMVDSPFYDDTSGFFFACLRPGLDALRTHCAASLRKCVLGSTCTVPAEAYVSLRTAFPNLSCLFTAHTIPRGSGTTSTSAEHEPDPAALPPSLPPAQSQPPSLTGLSIHLTDIVPSTQLWPVPWPIPTLKHLHIILEEHTPPAASAALAAPFLRAQSPYLASVHLDLRRCASSSGAAAASVLSAHCAHLVLVVRTYVDVPARVTHLGVFAARGTAYMHVLGGRRMRDAGLCEHMRCAVRIVRGLRLAGDAEDQEQDGQGGLRVVRRLGRATEAEWALFGGGGAELEALCVAAGAELGRGRCRVEDADGRDLLVILRGAQGDRE
ncbi:hypothetical protein DENSPDRAFT_619362 [Dentipellis sp. KUC8613]|nr:hypothetical protein DENSPDRAFT_619362 [Dentipellis sp. KUC8613]